MIYTGNNNNKKYSVAQETKKNQDNKIKKCFQAIVIKEHMDY